MKIKPQSPLDFKILKFVHDGEKFFSMIDPIGKMSSLLTVEWSHNKTLISINVVCHRDNISNLNLNMTQTIGKMNILQSNFSAETLIKNKITLIFISMEKNHEQTKRDLVGS